MTAEELLAELRAAACAYPEAYEEQPWGDLAVKVRGKVFAFYGVRDGSFSVTAKLPRSREAALAMPGVAPTHYGLGKHGWVTGRFPPEDADLPTLLGWVDESYRAVAPKTLGRSVPEGGPLPLSEGPLPELSPAAPRAVVVSDDPLRAARAIRALAASGVRAERRTTGDLDALAADAPDVLVVDLGRSASIALRLASELAVMHFDCPLVLAGLRDEAGARAVLPPDASFHREPPGHPEVVASTVARCQRGADNDLR